MGNFLFQIVEALLGLVEFVIVANAILSWLVAFDVVNYRNRFVASIGRTLEMLSRPMLWPLQKIIPPLGGIDITPIIALIVIDAARRYLVPWLFAPVIVALGG
jgi:YggT family protein